MNELTDVRGFEDVWRALRDPMRITPTLLRSPAFRARLSRLTRSAPPAVVSHVATLRSLPALKANLDYISRGATLALEGRDGERLAGKPQLFERAGDWEADRYACQDRLCLAYAYVASMPPGTEPQRVFAAASDFARTQFGASTDFVLARHDDEPHPHCHITVRAQKDDGVQIKPSPADLYRWREAFALSLREHGVDAEAAPRWAKGVVIRSHAHRVHYLERDHLDEGRPEPRYVRHDIDEAFALARGEADASRPWEGRIAATQQQVRDSYLRIADGLERLGGPQDQALARNVRSFVAQMAPPLTRREQLVGEARSIEASRALTQARGRDKDRDRDRSA